MRSYPCKVVGITYEGRYDYILAFVNQHDSLRLVAEPDNQYDESAVAVYHNQTRIGYIPTNRRWVFKSLAEGDTHEIVAKELIYNDDDVPSALAIEITITSDGQAESRRSVGLNFTERNSALNKIKRLPKKSQKFRNLGTGDYLLLTIAFLLLLWYGFKTPIPIQSGNTPSFAAQPNSNIIASSAPKIIVGSAPKGKEKVVALKIIQENFEPLTCSKIVAATRLEDGSIKAKCNTQEEFRIFSIQGKVVAMRCSALKKLGIQGC
jgi:HIRAN domain